MMDELIERLEKATGPDRELDGAIALSLGWTFQKMKGDSKPYYRKPGETTYYMRSEVPAYTASIDAALTLVPEGWAYQLTLLFEPRVHGNQQAIVWPPDKASPVSGAPTMPLAICIAALKARA
jgi:hypothetical protein